MAEVVRVILLIALAAALLTTLALALSWWMEPPRRIRRALLKALGAPPEVEAVSALWDAALAGETGSPGEALRLGRRWLSHLEALLKS